MNKNLIHKKIVSPTIFSLFFICAVLGLLAGSYFWGNRIEPGTVYDSFFFVQLHQLLDGYPFVIFLLSFTLVVLVAFLLFQCNEKYSFIRVRTILPSFLFIFFITSSNHKIEDCSGLIGCIFLLMFIWIFLSTYQERQPVGSIFNAFFFLSVGSFVCFDLLLLVPACWLSFSFFRIASLRTFLASLIGLLTPYIICLPILLFWPESFDGFIASVERHFTFSFSFPTFSIHQLYWGILLFLLLMLAFITFLGNINADKIRTRQTLYFFYLLAFTVFIISMLKTDSFIDLFPVLIMTSSILLGHYFSLKNSLFSFICFIAMILVSVIFYLM